MSNDQSQEPAGPAPTPGQPSPVGTARTKNPDPSAADGAPAKDRVQDAVLTPTLMGTEYKLLHVKASGARPETAAEGTLTRPQAVAVLEQQMNALAAEGWRFCDTVLDLGGLGRYLVFSRYAALAEQG